MVDDRLTDSPRSAASHLLTTEHLAAIVDSSDDAIVSKDLNGIVRSWNPAAERLFGYTAAEMIGRPMLVVIPEDRHGEERMILGRIREGDRVEHLRTVRVRKDGESINVSMTVSPIRDAQGDVVGASNIARDDSLRIEAETANEHLAAIIASSDDAIVSKDLDGTVRSWNRGAERLFGYLAEEMIGQPILKLLPADRQFEETSILDRIRRGERIDHFETIRVRKDGRLVDVSVTISPIRDSTGRVVGASKVARDISERKMFEATTAALTLELEQRVKERTSELEAANRELESFTYSIAHDLRAPLRAITATSAMVIEDFGDSLPTAVHPFLHRQAAAAEHLSRLVDDLLTYSRLGKSEVRIVPVDLTALANQIVANLPETAHRFTVEPKMTVEGDQSLIFLMLQNLIENAVKFSPEGGEIKVGKAGSAFYVRDHGTGFDMLYAEKIFAPFERLVRHAEVPGTGIGLANVKRIVDKHHGSIWASSVLGEGTTMYFTLRPGT